MERDGAGWSEMERDGARWSEMERDGARARAESAPCTRNHVQISLVELVAHDDAGHPASHDDAHRLELRYFSRVIRHQPDALDLQFAQDMPHGAVLPAVVRQSQRPVCLHRVQSSLLESVRSYFVRQANSSPLLLTIYDDPWGLVLDVPHGEVQLLAAVTLEAADDLRRPASVVHPHDHVLLSLHPAADDCGRFGERFPAVDGVPVAAESKLAHTRRKQGLGHELCPYFIRSG